MRNRFVVMMGPELTRRTKSEDPVDPHAAGTPMNSRGRVSMDTAPFVSASSHAMDQGRCLERNPRSQHALSWVGEGFNEPPESVETGMGKTWREC
jgi:hypothetical protein